MASRQTGTATSILRALLGAAGRDIRLKVDGVSKTETIILEKKKMNEKLKCVRVSLKKSSIKEFAVQINFHRYLERINRELL